MYEVLDLVWIGYELWLLLTSGFLVLLSLIPDGV